MNILITGATGFLGTHVQSVLRSKTHNLTLIDRNTRLEELKGEYDCLLHLAAKAHVPEYLADKNRKEYLDANIEYTKAIAHLAKNLQIKRFVFLSSIKVHGKGLNRPFTETDTLAPKDFYSLTKAIAEDELKKILAGSMTDYTIVRPPLIYGTHAKANFRKLVHLCKLPLPLPLGSVHNKRSFISVDNLVNFIELCFVHPQASNEIFLISDDDDVSTTELLIAIKKHIHCKRLLIPVPVFILKLFFKLIGKEDLNERLIYSYQADISKAKRLLNWKPVISFEDGIARSVNEGE